MPDRPEAPDPTPAPSLPGVRVRYQTIEFRDLDLHVRALRDRNQFVDDEGVAEGHNISSAAWPMFGLVWDSALVLADLMLDAEVDGLRILEVGCGLGLASLILNHRGADITATDHHPEVNGFLQGNAALNGDGVIPFVRTGWTDGADELGRFDLVIASEVLYERSHAEALATFIDQHANPRCRVVIIDPGRGHGNRFRRHMLALGFEGDKRQAEAPDVLEDRPAGHLWEFTR